MLVTLDGMKTLFGVKYEKKFWLMLTIEVGIEQLGRETPKK